MRRLLLIAALVALALSQVLRATTMVAVSFSDLVDKSDLIFVGQVVDQRSYWEATREGRSISTAVTFNVVRVLKGSVGPVMQLAFLGGTVGDVTLDVTGMPRFKIGDRDVLFVGPVRTAVSPLVGFAQGRVRIDRDPRTARDVVRMHDGSPLPSTAAIGAVRRSSLTPAPPMALADFESEVRVALRRGPQ